jgi:hypothetical protein
VVTVYVEIPEEIKEKIMHWLKIVGIENRMILGFQNVNTDIFIAFNVEIAGACISLMTEFIHISNNI